MRRGTISVAIGLALIAAAWARGQGPPQNAAKVETSPLELTPPERYHVASALEPIREVDLMATSDGVVRSVALAVGSTVREGQEIVQLDRTEASARLKIAQANVKEMQAEAEAAKADTAKKSAAAVAGARLEAAQARAELAQLDVDRCTIRAPFSGRLLALSVSPGQYVAKGTTIAELADTASLRVLVPLNRSEATVNGNANLTIEGRPVPGKIQAVLPLNHDFAPLRDLAAPLAAAWVTVENTRGAYEPGQRARTNILPVAPLAVVPSRSVHGSSGESKGASIVQVVRNEYVTNVPVTVLGDVGPERTQVSGPFRPADVLIVESSPPLAANTLIRFNGQGAANRPVESVAPSPNTPSEVADINPPNGVAPIGAGSPPPAAPRGAPRPNAGRSPAIPGPAANAPSTKPAAKKASDVVPF
jgi:RND family efflux transporter MFP subunit